MSNFRIAYRYANSIYQEAKNNNQVDAVLESFTYLQRLVEQSVELNSLLKSPVVSAKDKREVLGEICNEEPKEIQNFLTLLVDKKREMYLPAIIKKFVEIYYQAHSISEATVISAHPITEETMSEVKQLLSKQINAKEIRFKTEINPDLLGGIIIKYGDKMLDLSVASELNSFRKQLIYN